MVGANRPVLGSEADSDSANLAVGVGELPFGLDPRPCVQVKAIEPDVLALEGVMHSGLAEVVENRLLEGRRLSVGCRGDLRTCGRRPLVVEDTVGRQALDGEPPGDPHLPAVFERLVNEQFGLGVTGDGSVNFVATHALPDIGILRDRLQRDVRNPLVDEPLLDVASIAISGRRVAREVSLFGCAFGGIGEQVVGKSRAHQSRAGECERNSAGVNGDPATTPLLGDIRRRA